MTIIPFKAQHMDDMMHMVLGAEEALGLPPQADAISDVGASYFDQADMLLVALDDNNSVVGCVSAKLEDESMWLERLYVKASLNRQGIGRQLLLLAEAFAADCRIRTINVHLDPAFAASRFFYHKHGYVEYSSLYLQKRL